MSKATNAIKRRQQTRKWRRKAQAGEFWNGKSWCRPDSRGRMRNWAKCPMLDFAEPLYWVRYVAKFDGVERYVVKYG